MGGGGKSLDSQTSPGILLLPLGGGGRGKSLGNQTSPGILILPLRGGGRGGKFGQPDKSRHSNPTPKGWEGEKVFTDRQVQASFSYSYGVGGGGKSLDTNSKTNPGILLIPLRGRGRGKSLASQTSPGILILPLRGGGGGKSLDSQTSPDILLLPLSVSSSFSFAANPKSDILTLLSSTNRIFSGLKINNKLYNISIFFIILKGVIQNYSPPQGSVLRFLSRGVGGRGNFAKCCRNFILSKYRPEAFKLELGFVG